MFALRVGNPTIVQPRGNERVSAKGQMFVTFALRIGTPIIVQPRASGPLFVVCIFWQPRHFSQGPEA
eukprot:4646307-Lingulodinium_polyedra.AAC.1